MPENNQFALFGLPGGPSVGNAERRAILEQNQMFRDRRMHGLRDIEFGHVALNIPPLDFEVLKRRYPDLVSPDAGVRTAKWKWFLRQPESEQYKISKHEGHRVGADRMGAGSRIVVPTTYTRRVD